MTGRRSTYDAVIVGAGPSGSVLARLLALQGANVLMLDAAAFPRRKPCGESLNPGAVNRLSQLYGDGKLASFRGLLNAASIPFEMLSGWRLNSGGVTLEAEYPAGLAGIGIRRESLDYWLVQQACDAGVQFEDRCRAERLLWENDRVIGTAARLHNGEQLLISARYVAGADGIRSAMARSAKLSGFGKLRKAAMTARIKGVQGLNGKVELFVTGDTVIGLAPIGSGQANMTIALRSNQLLESAKIGKNGFLMAQAQRIAELRERFSGAEIEGEVLTCGPFERIVQSNRYDGLLLTGDAAGYFDPMTGQGLYRAVRSAELAADALIEAMRTGSFAPLHRYERQRNYEFAAPLRMQKLIEGTSRHEWLLRTSMRAIGASRMLTTRLAESIGDCVRL
ncbi:NAD(P)/FAD-dependent oxidoreductase [Paenibacillus sp. NEAU-GSW1]|uniref:NAD(P)/FAD-dependent oxidoreductase n=1 Tax=Paenibacillus sp. NEAU-GSW1 TaxID=2682486 RepID=UPI0012E0E797|nr:NAD(P)/FAD-dependent oxidoreductase [Paenibacillus sp. NEAU-GSW1]MUT65372.1 hypothetical protein [Paenibacillus sp. NEAU-GSW1]